MQENALVFTGIIVQEEKVFTSLCLELDVVSQGDSIAEAKNALAKATALYLETAIENNMPYIRPVPANQDPRQVNPNDVIETFPLGVNEY